MSCGAAREGFAGKLGDDACGLAPRTTERKTVRRARAVRAPECFLVVLGRPMESHAALLEARLQVAAVKWRTTARELDVLRLLVSGDTNKEIALELGCSEVSIERHVTQLLRKAKCDGRSRLIAAFWTAP